MSGARPSQRIEWIALDRITVVNPRSRNKKTFKEITENIAQIGLKRPITVTRRIEAEGPFYDLVCGQGRLEAYQALGQVEVPALVVSADAEDCLIASLVENCARRQHNAFDLLQDIGGMRERGHSSAEIARKTGLSAEYVNGVARLIEKGEQRLLRSVESRTIPISVAVEIAEADDHDVQRALQGAYEKGLLRGRKLLAAKRLRAAADRLPAGSSSQAGPVSYLLAGNSWSSPAQAQLQHFRGGKRPNLPHFRQAGAAGSGVELARRPGDVGHGAQGRPASRRVLPDGASRTPRRPAFGRRRSHPDDGNAGTIVDRHPEVPVHYAHGTLDGSTHAMKDQVHALADGRPNARVTTFYQCPRPEDITGIDFDQAGLIDEQWLRDETMSVEADYYLCGPRLFLRTFVATLSLAGIAADRIHYEFFGPADELLAA